MEKTKHIAFSTQKGGAGKTTLTVLVASYLHYVMGYNVAIIDCDYPQHSILEMRKREKELAKRDSYYGGKVYRLIERIRKEGYKIYESSPERVLQTLDTIDTSNLDVVFYDLPGTVDRKGMIHTLSTLDYILVPVSADQVVLESTLNFAVTLNDQIITTGLSNIQGMYLFWNMVDGREKSELYEVYETIMAELGLQIMENYFPNGLRFRHEISGLHRPVFRSTILPPDNEMLKDSNLELFCVELINLIKLGSA